jgi:hypothetical protein
MSTLAEIRTNAYSILKEPETSSAYPVVFMDELLNTAQRKICLGKVSSDKWTITKPPLEFLFSENWYTSSQQATLDTDAVVWWATLSWTIGDWFADSGVLFINWDYITYTGKTSTWFTGCSGILFAHLSWSVVKQAYETPTDLWQVTNLIYNYRSRLSGVDYRDFHNMLSENNYFSFWGSSANSIYYEWRYFYVLAPQWYILVYWPNTDSKSLQLSYQKKPATMTESVDSTVPDDYALSTIPYLAVWEMLFNRGEQDRWLQLTSYGVSNIKEMYAYYSQRIVEDQHNIRVSNIRNSVWLNI